MDIDFFKEDGNFGQEATNHGNFTFVTTKVESNFMGILHARGFLDGLSAAAALTSAETQWNVARPDLPAPLDTAPFAPTLTLPVGTELHLSLTNQLGLFWGTATLNGQSINAARKEITKYLKAGRYALAHSGGVALLNHIANTTLRDNLKIATATVTDLDTPLSGTLYFRAEPVQKAPLRVAPDASGQTKLSNWTDDVEAFVDQAGRALQEIRREAVFMAGDLSDLDSIWRALQVIWDVGMLGTIRDNASIWSSPSPGYSVLESLFQKTFMPISEFALTFFGTVLKPALPTGHFGFEWTLEHTEAGKTFAWIQTLRAGPYKALADAVKKAPAAYIRLATSVCDLELEMLCERAADGDRDKVLRAEMESACEWLDTGTGDAPDSAGGAGILLGMLSAIPADIPRPPGLSRLAMCVTALHALLSAAEADTRPARDARLRGAVARVLDLPSATITEFRQSSGWDYVFSASGIKKETSAAVRLPQIPYEAMKNGLKGLAERLAADTASRVLKRMEALNRAAKGAPMCASQLLGVAVSDEVEATSATQAATQSQLESGMAALGPVIAWIRIVGFFASGIQFVEDVLKCIRDGGASDDLWKIAKDGASSIGSFVRDFVSTRLALDKTMPPEAFKKWTGYEKSLLRKNVGGALGVASGIWTFVDGVKKDDVLLETSGAFTALGYGLRTTLFTAADLELFSVGALTFELSVPLILIGASLEIWTGTQPIPADQALEKQLMNMVNGVARAMTAWYGRRHDGVPWRATDSADLETALQAGTQRATACDSATHWTAFRPYSADDAADERSLLTRFGFSSSEATQLVADESAITYSLRGSPAGGALSGWSWPAVDEM
ncbi:MAG: hypothetical protein ACRELB_00785 [Polyangiaceae bacterium]